MSKKEQISKALDSVAEHTVMLVDFAKTYEEEKLFSSCTGCLTTFAGKPGYQLYRSILKIIDIFDLAYIVSAHSEVDYKISIQWVYGECGESCIFYELVSKEDYDAWQSKRRR